MYAVDTLMMQLYRFYNRNQQKEKRKIDKIRFRQHLLGLFLRNFEKKNNTKVLKFTYYIYIGNLICTFAK